jgi:hypothetical protein
MYANLNLFATIMNLDDHLKSLVLSSNPTGNDLSVEIAALDQWFSYVLAKDYAEKQHLTL